MNLPFESTVVQNVTAITNVTTGPGVMAEKPTVVKPMNLHFGVGSRFHLSEA